MQNDYFLRCFKCIVLPFEQFHNRPSDRTRIFVLFCHHEERQFQSVQRARENARWPGLRAKYSKYEKSAENERWATKRIGARDRCRRSVFSRAIVFSFRARWSSRRRSRFVPIKRRRKYWCTEYSIIRVYAMCE